MPKDEQGRKYCSRCKRTKDDGVERFRAQYRYTTADGTEKTSWYCRDCKKDNNDEYYDKDYFREYLKNYDGYDPKKQRAHTKVYRAIKSGELERPDECQNCGRSDRRIEGHHEDYSKPLDVTWLCTPCHADLHAEE